MALVGGRERLQDFGMNRGVVIAGKPARASAIGILSHRELTLTSNAPCGDFENELSTLLVSMHLASLFMISTTALLPGPDSGVYRFDLGTYKCVNHEGQEGHNANTLGECALLYGKSLPRLKLKARNMRGSLMVRANLTDSELPEVDLTAADMAFAIFDSVQMPKAQLIKAQFDGASIARAQLTSVQARGSRWVSAQAQLTNLEGSDLSEAVLNHADFSLSNWHQASIVGASAEGAHFIRADMRTLDFKLVNAAHAVFDFANLADVRVIDSAMELTSFCGANLVGTRWVRTALFGADLRGADLRNASFDETDLTNARFNLKTKLPFDHAAAVERGMILDESECKPPMTHL